MFTDLAIHTGKDVIQWKDVKPNDAPKDSEILTKLLLCDLSHRRFSY